MTNLVTNYNFLFIIVIILVTNNFFFKLVSKLVTILTNNCWSRKWVTNETFSFSNSSFFSHMILIFSWNQRPDLRCFGPLRRCLNNFFICVSKKSNLCLLVMFGLFIFAWVLIRASCFSIILSFWFL